MPKTQKEKNKIKLTRCIVRGLSDKCCLFIDNFRFKYTSVCVACVFIAPRFNFSIEIASGCSSCCCCVNVVIDDAKDGTDVCDDVNDNGKKFC